jgi:hypothetical protein
MTLGRAPANRFSLDNECGPSSSSEHAATSAATDAAQRRRETSAFVDVTASMDTVTANKALLVRAVVALVVAGAA